jgi:hypothetical protein
MGSFEFAACATKASALSKARKQTQELESKFSFDPLAGGSMAGPRGTSESCGELRDVLDSNEIGKQRLMSEAMTMKQPIQLILERFEMSIDFPYLEYLLFKCSLHQDKNVATLAFPSSLLTYFDYYQQL